MEVCGFCGQSFKNIESVIGHQQRNKTCLSKQGKNTIRCIYCKKSYTSQKHLESHLERCKVAKKIEYDELRKENIMLKQEIENKTQTFKDFDLTVKHLIDIINSQFVNNEYRIKYEEIKAKYES